LHLKGGEQERRVVAIELPELVVVDHTVSVVVNLIPVGEANFTRTRTRSGEGGGGGGSRGMCGARTEWGVPVRGLQE
jgi:hypothetical protein